MKVNTAVVEREQGAAVSLEGLQRVSLRALQQTPTVSVLITCFNYGPYVGEAIESALRQTYPVSEVIVSDDGSTDNSCEVIDGYVRRDTRVRLVRGRHGGMASCLNGAYRAATGDIVCLLDADDVFLPAKVKAVINAFRNNPTAGFCGHPTLLIDHKGRRRGIYPLGSMPAGDCAAETFANAGILIGLPPTTNLSLRREVADRIFPIPEDLTGYAEQMIHRLAPLTTDLCCVTDALAEWRQHGKNDQKATQLNLKRVNRELEIMHLLWQKQRDYLASNNPLLAHAFPGLERSAYFRKLHYIQSRLAGSADARARYRALFASPIGGTKDRLFWQLSRFLPQPLFGTAVNLVMTQGVLKELFARLARKRT
jgi:glycosyltransferase involved in cell wall biosynthesis